MQLLEGGKGRGMEAISVHPIGRETVPAFRTLGLDLALVPIAERERPVRGLAAFLDWTLAGAISRSLLQVSAEQMMVPGSNRAGVERIVVLGFSPEQSGWATELGERMFGLSLALGGRRVALALPSEAGGLSGAEEALEAFCAAQSLVYGEQEPPYRAWACAQPALVGRLASKLAGPIRPAWDG